MVEFDLSNYGPTEVAFRKLLFNTGISSIDELNEWLDPHNGIYAGESKIRFETEEDAIIFKMKFL